jgi:hypothetical protein
MVALAGKVEVEAVSGAEREKGPMRRSSYAHHSLRGACPRCEFGPHDEHAYFDIHGIRLVLELDKQ